MGKPYFDVPAGGGRGVALALSHRGFALDGQENTLAAMEAAIKMGFAYLEIDVRTTRDGVVMVFHDERLERVTDGTGRVADLTASELAKVRVRGREPIPTLAEVLARWPDVKLNIDVKDDGSVQPFVDVIEAAAAHDRVLVASFSDRRRLRVLRALSRLAASSAGMAVSAMIRILAPLGLAGWIARRARVDCLQVPRRYRGIPVVTEPFVRRCAAADLPVHVWTINEAPEMEELLGLGVGGLVSDRADLLAQVMASRGEWPQHRLVP